MREPDVVQWFVISIALSVALTVLVNVGFRAVPGANDRAARSVTRLGSPTVDDTATSGRRVRVWTPWKAMLIGSVVLTIAVNLVFWIA